MEVVGIVVEYNPFHNGHLHHLNEIKKLYSNSIIIAVMSGNFNQRGEVSIIPKWNKAAIALKYGVDIVIELPYVFASQSADLFAQGSINILGEIKITKLVFGSESNDIELIKKMAHTQINNKEYNNVVKSFLNMGHNYPTSMSKGLMELTNEVVNTPNDILGICYVKEILKQKYSIDAVCIKRTNDYHETELTNEIASATSIRLALKNNKDVKDFVPSLTYDYLQKKLFFNDQYFKYLKFKILSTDNLSIYHTVDEGIEFRIKKAIVKSKSWDELINNIKTKRYTYNKISRMLIHILNNFTKDEALKCKNIEYIRILGFSKVGQKYLNKIKKEVSIPIITNFSSIKSDILNIEQRVTNVYASSLDEIEKIKLIESEYKNKPIKKDT